MRVNGPEDALDWDALDWRRHEDNVRRIRRRIFTATRDGDWPKVRNLQRLLLRSWSNTLLAVRQVTQRNAGRRTAGIDGEVALTSAARAELAVRVHQSVSTWQPRAVRRVYIPKARSSKLRALGIPVIMDRCHQARAKNALEAEWEARLGPRVYGFRPGRSCHDAVEAVFNTCHGPTAKRVWALDADLAKAFDKIDHNHLLAMVGSFPGRGMISDWLKAGVFEHGKGFAPTEEGVPQGGPLSPVLLNVALHGIEQAAGVRYHTSGANAGHTKPGSPVLVTYADDLIALCETRDQAVQVKARLADWLAPRGLSFNEDKTRVVSLDKDGVDFLGFTIRRYQNRQGGKLLIKPSKAAVGRLRKRLATELRALRGGNAAAVLVRITPITRGWAVFYRGAVSKEVFNALDDYLWQRLYKWAVWSHSNKPKTWVVNRYFGTFNPDRQDRWVFGDRNSGAYLPKLAWTKIERHRLVPGTASPDDPALADYWARRRRRTKPPLDRNTLRLLHKQHGRCDRCGDHLLHADREPHSPTEWEQWLTTTRKAITRKIVVAVAGEGTPNGHRLVHTHCWRRATGASKDPAPLQT
jgi:RNA-directed DNA polymerase